MKVRNWFGAAVALFFLFSALTSPDGYGQRFDQNPTHGGRTPTPAEHNTLQGAINNIRTPPPSSITFVDEDSNSKTVSCSSIAATLQAQLDSDSGMEVETVETTSSWTLPDGKDSTAGDQMNVNPGAIAGAAQSDSSMRALEGILVHEWTHKTQDSASLSNANRAEVEPYSAMHAYYCSTASRHPAPGDWLPGWARNAYTAFRNAWQNGRVVRNERPRQVADKWYALSCDTSIVPLSDSLIIIDLNHDVRSAYPLMPMSASDFYVIPNHWMLPPEHSLVVVCGGMPPSGMARILLLDVFNGEVIGPVWQYDFGPPDWPPMFFYSMERAEMVHFWYVADTLNQRILLMQDVQLEDGVPDEIVSVFANAAEPGFELLGIAHGLDRATHRFMGTGLLANVYDAHIYELMNPYQMNYFLLDPDGDLHADFMMPLPLYEFTEFRPAIQVPLPWAGENFVQIYGSWEHDIAVMSTDETGQIVFEDLGMVHMAPGIDAECPLIRPLFPDEYIRPVDMQTGKSTGVTQVIDPTPQDFTIFYIPLEDVMEFCWKPVAGAGHYQIWWIDDLNDPAGWTEFSPPLFADDFESGTTDCWSTVLPLRTEERHFFRITASR